MEVLIVDPKPIEKKIKGLVELKRMSAVRLVADFRQKSRKKSIHKKEGSLSKSKR